MNIVEIEESLRSLVEQPFDVVDFPLRFLEIYGSPKATITKLRQTRKQDLLGEGDVLLKKRFMFRASPRGEAEATIEAMAVDAAAVKHAPRFMLATDGVEFFALDSRGDRRSSGKLAKLHDQFDFFLPMAGFERHEGVPENPADIKATARLAKLYDAILQANPTWDSPERAHELNLFVTRLLFCFFAEDTSIFPKDLFTSSVMSWTSQDGLNTDEVLAALFLAMDTSGAAREGLPEFARRFPYVNGGLFLERTPIPKFSRRSRRLLQECGELSWRDISPDIFGSMIQAVVEPGKRGDMGMHYTSVPNIMKALRPLFLLSLEEEFEAARDSPARLDRLLGRIYNIRVFDPACGSGNFLIIAYRELRKIESRIFGRQREIGQRALPMTGLRLTQFFGIELADYAAETAKLSLWIAEYQMNSVFKSEFGDAPAALPLSDSSNILHGNACRVEWRDFCPPNNETETYIVGNPPYLGGKKLSAEQAVDMDASGLKAMRQVDYIGCWFVRASRYIANGNSQYAFVTTSSVCQGEQVHLLWDFIFRLGLEIDFAYGPFAWSNNARNNAVVFCAIVGVRSAGDKRQKWIYDETHARAVKNISPYLIEGTSDFVSPAGSVLTGLPAMCMGSNPVDGKHLIVEADDYEVVVHAQPEAARFFKRYMGGEDFLHGNVRYCIWLDDANVEEGRAVPFIKRRLDSCQAYRLGAGRDAKKTASAPHRFCYRSHRDAPAIIVPNTSAATRLFVPCGFVDENTVISKEAFAIYDPEAYVLGILSSTLHRVWLSHIGGRLVEGYRYSVKLVYNTFPVPSLSAGQKQDLEDLAWAIVAARERHPGKSLAWLYDPKNTPPELRGAHAELDELLECIYNGRVFKNDTERFDHLFKKYLLMIRSSEAQPASRQRRMAA